jgi:cytochrome c oxidase assembly protein subunit 15
MLDETPARRDPARAPRCVEDLALGFALLAGLTWALIVLGALVRAHGAGLACPDWPLCFGEVVPALDVRVAFEYSHRIVAGSVSLCFAALALVAWRRARAGDPIRRRLLLAAALLALQITLGALTVWHLLAYWTVTSHLIVGNGVAATFAWTALDLRARQVSRSEPTASEDQRRARGTAPAEATPGQRRMLAAVLALLAFQLVLGGLVSSRYAGLSCPEWPTCNGGAWFPSWRGPVGLHLVHRTNGYLLLIALIALARICRTSPRLARATHALAGIAFAQIAVGVANVLSGIPVELTGLHSALAAALVILATTAAHAAWGSAKPCPRRD